MRSSVALFVRTLHAPNDAFIVKGTTGGNIATEDAAVYLNFSPWGYMPVENVRNAILADNYGYAIRSIHEIIHLATRYGLSDQQLAVAAHDLTKIETNYPTDPAKATVLAWSRYWNDILKDRCPPVRK